MRKTENRYKIEKIAASLSSAYMASCLHHSVQILFRGTSDTLNRYIKSLAYWDFADFGYVVNDFDINGFKEKIKELLFG